jgi:hypothetical protein
VLESNYSLHNPDITEGWELICCVKLNAWNPGWVKLPTLGGFGATAVGPQPLIAWFNACYGRLNLNVRWLNSSVVPGVSAGKASIVLGSRLQKTFT